jgi:hypothetical protein
MGIKQSYFISWDERLSQRVLQVSFLFKLWLRFLLSFRYPEALSEKLQSAVM